MKIEIDTLRDSAVEIRKAITLLQSLVEHPTMQQPVKNIFESSSAETPAQSMFGLFDTPPNEKKTEAKIEYY